MVVQHRTYVETLRSLGLTVTVLEPLAAYPDAYFVEDVAVVTTEVAIITRPGAPSRQGETTAMVPVLAQFRPLAHIEPPGTLEGGDVLQIGRRFLIGLSERTNQAGAEQLGRLLERYGCPWVTVPLPAGLHLKSSITYIGHNTVLVTAELANNPALSPYRLVIIDADEAYAANCLLVNDHLIIPQGFPKLRRQLAGLGRSIVELDVSEARKMDGGLTCMSLRL
jgi:dimethylargininase